MSKPIPKLGQRLFSLNVGNAARCVEQVLTPVDVVKVGRKYFTTKNINDTNGWSLSRYHLENWVHDNGGRSATSCLYKSEKEFETEKLQRELVSKIEDIVNRRMLRSLSAASLQQVLEIIDYRALEQSK